MTATIHLPDNALTPTLLRFIDVSPLSYCCTVGYDGGTQVVRTDRALVQLSDAERFLWEFLESVVKGPWGAFLDRADGITTAALSDLFAHLCMARRAA